MEGQLVKKTFTLDNIDLDCWVIKIGRKFWFKAHVIAVFLGYKNPNQAILKNIPPEERKQWVEIEPSLGERVLIPPNWKPHTVMVSEGGVYMLICTGKKPEAIRFEKWVFDKVLPSIRETGTYVINQLLNEQVLQLQISNVKLQDNVSKLRDRAAVITNSNETKYAFQLYISLKNPSLYICIKTQTKNLPTAIKKVDPDEYRLLISKTKLSNSMSILNRLKEKKENKAFFQSLG